MLRRCAIYDPGRRITQESSAPAPSLRPRRPFRCRCPCIVVGVVVADIDVVDVGFVMSAPVPSPVLAASSTSLR